MGGLISYPRTESSRYPPSFDVGSLLRDHAGHRDWGAHAASVLAEAGAGGVRPPHTGKDAGDHPPITPMACGRPAGESDWRLYNSGPGPPGAVKRP